MTTIFDITASVMTTALTTPSPFETDALAGLTDALEVLGTSFTYEDEDYTGIQSDNASEYEWQSGGALRDYKFSLVCNKADFSVLPVDGKTLSLGGVTYRILRVVTSAGDPAVTLDCGSPHK